MQTPAPVREAGVKSPEVRKAKPKTAKNDRVGSGARGRFVVDVQETVSQTLYPAANPFFDEAASLDDDIKLLKDQLAQKLRLQNAQLRTMLERFQRS
jgi:hypothetical protein